MLFSTLKVIGEKLNKEGVLWAVGASIMLNHYGLVDGPKDIDILVDIKDIEKADRILKGIGEKKTWERVASYSTKYFYEYVINGVDIDVMAGLIINHSNSKYQYTFDASSISDIKNIDGVDIPLTSLEDWYVIYQLIEGRENKVRMIENYLLEHGIKKPELLKRALTKDLPYNVRNRVEKLLI